MSYQPRRPSPPRRPGGRKKKVASKEEQERLLREEREAAERADLLKKEIAGEELQKEENELRDKLEAKERKRLKKEQQQASITEKDATIGHLSVQINDINRSYSTLKGELEDELHRLLQVKEVLENDNSNLRTEMEQSNREMTEERSLLRGQAASAKESLERERAESEQKEKASQDNTTALTRQLTKASAENQLLRSAKEEKESELINRIKTLEREYEKAMSLNKALQEVVENREMEDKKNVALMELLSSQLDEQKRRADDYIGRESGRADTYAQELDELRERSRALTEDNAELTATNQKLTDDSARLEAEYKGKIDQMKFDTKFLHSELNIYKSKLNKRVSEQEDFEKTMASEHEGQASMLEDSKSKVDHLEQTLRKRDRDHFDKVTFLNAQISNNRTIILQLQNKLQMEKESRIQEVGALSQEMQRKARQIATVENEIDKSKLQQTEAQVRLGSDVSALKTTAFQLQSSLLDKEREMDTRLAEKDSEIRRLRRRLEENFIAYRSGENKVIDERLPEPPQSTSSKRSPPPVAARTTAADEQPTSGRVRLPSVEGGEWQG